MKIVTASQMREIDRACARQGIPASTLMENAGRAVAEETRRLLGRLDGRQVLCLVGAGNNGGDGLVAARYLHEWGALVTVYLCSRRPDDDANLKLVKERGIACTGTGADKGLKKFQAALDQAACVIDALLGTGKIRPLEGVYKRVLEGTAAAKLKRKVFMVAVDLPSGLDADTGAIDGACPYADLTVTLAFPKPGLFIFPGAARVGKLVVADIGIPAALADTIKIELLTADWAKRVLPARPPDANKGTFGKVMVAAGSEKYIGAGYLACAAALRAGAGLVTLAAARSLTSITANKLAEVTYLPLPEAEPGIIAEEAGAILRREIGTYNVLLLGCGLGQHPATAGFVKSILGKKGLPPLVVDADGLNIISKVTAWWRKLPDAAVLTPHPGEMSRLSGLTIEQVQADRSGMALKYAGAWRKTIILKGACTIIAAADGRCFISPFANPGLATAGTGDVLAGVVAGLAAQGLPLFEAAALGVYLHGATADMIKDIMGDAGMLASDILTALPVKMKQLKNKG